jgi:tRNA A-37 threonylcarbamoyl transferase component Bud32
MEHISHNLIEYLDKVKVSEMVRVSILKQLGFTLIQLHVIDRMTHGDIGSGNMMLDVSEPRRNEYVIGGKTYSVDTQGFEPILIDFQISTAYRGKPSKDLLIAEITLAYDILERWIHWDLKELITHVEEAKTLRELTVLIDSIV